MSVHPAARISGRELRRSTAGKQPAIHEPWGQPQVRDTFDPIVTVQE